MFKEDEPGDTRINWERTQEVIESGASAVASNCPFCLTMLTDGIKNKEKEDQVEVLDLAEMIARNL
jgi:Fe-S oxidoreductase